MGSNAPVPPYLVFAFLVALSTTKLIGRQNIQVRVTHMPLTELVTGHFGCDALSPCILSIN